MSPDAAHWPGRERVEDDTIIPCKCLAFDLWYVDTDKWPPIDVCMCGHPMSEHDGPEKVCMGILVRV